MLRRLFLSLLLYRRIFEITFFLGLLRMNNYCFTINIINLVLLLFLLHLVKIYTILAVTLLLLKRFKLTLTETFLSMSINLKSIELFTTFLTSLQCLWIINLLWTAHSIMYLKLIDWKKFLTSIALPLNLWITWLLIWLLVHLYILM